MKPVIEEKREVAKMKGGINKTIKKWSNDIDRVWYDLLIKGKAKVKIK